MPFFKTSPTRAATLLLILILSATTKANDQPQECPFYELSFSQEHLTSESDIILTKKITDDIARMKRLEFAVDLMTNGEASGLAPMGLDAFAAPGINVPGTIFLTPVFQETPESNLLARAGSFLYLHKRFSGYIPLSTVTDSMESKLALMLAKTSLFLEQRALAHFDHDACGFFGRYGLLNKYGDDYQYEINMMSDTALKNPEELPPSLRYYHLLMQALLSGPDERVMQSNSIAARYSNRLRPHISLADHYYWQCQQGSIDACEQASEQIGILTQHRVLPMNVYPTDYCKNPFRLSTELLEQLPVSSQSNFTRSVELDHNPNPVFETGATDPGNCLRIVVSDSYYAIGPATDRPNRGISKENRRRLNLCCDFIKLRKHTKKREGSLYRPSLQHISDLITFPIFL